jgi:hypothetical protein
MMPQHVDPSDQPPRGATPGVAADGAVTYNRKDKRYARDERRSFVFLSSHARALPSRHENAPDAPPRPARDSAWRSIARSENDFARPSRGVFRVFFVRARRRF